MRDNKKIKEMANNHNVSDDALLKMLRDSLTDETLRDEKNNELQRKSPYSKWNQVNQNPQLRRCLRVFQYKYPIAAYILDFFMTEMDESNAIVVSQKKLGEILGFSRQSINKNLKTLIEYGIITKEPVGSVNVYHINAAIVWHSYGSKIKFAKLNNAAVILDKEPTLTEFHKENAYKKQKPTNEFTNRNVIVEEETDGDRTEIIVTDDETGEVLLQEEPLHMTSEKLFNAAKE